MARFADSDPSVAAKMHLIVALHPELYAVGDKIAQRRYQVNGAGLPVGIMSAR
jgi:hypothetical protein